VRLWIKYLLQLVPAFAITLAASLTFLLAVPGAWDQTISEHLKFEDVLLKHRVWSLWHHQGFDFYPFVFGATGLLIGVSTNNPARFYCGASLLSIATIFLPNEFFQHYYNLLVVPLMLGVGVFFLSTAAVLTFINPIYAFEADKEITPHPYVATMRLFKMTGDRYSDEFYKRLISSSCTIVMTPADKKFLGMSRATPWFQEYPRLPLSGGIDVLLDKSSACLAKG